jgi:hypothetical protein
VPFVIAFVTVRIARMSPHFASSILVPQDAQLGIGFSTPA